MNNTDPNEKSKPKITNENMESSYDDDEWQDFSRKTDEDKD